MEVTLQLWNCWPFSSCLLSECMLKVYILSSIGAALSQNARPNIREQLRRWSESLYSTSTPPTTNAASAKPPALWISPPTTFTGPLHTWHLAEGAGTSLPSDSKTAPSGSASTQNAVGSQHQPGLIKPIPAPTIVLLSLHLLYALYNVTRDVFFVAMRHDLLAAALPIQHSSVVLYSYLALSCVFFVLCIYCTLLQLSQTVMYLHFMQPCVPCCCITSCSWRHSWTKHHFVLMYRTEV